MERDVDLSSETLQFEETHVLQDDAALTGLLSFCDWGTAQTC